MMLICPTFVFTDLGSRICNIQVMQCDILDYLLLFVDVAFGQRHILLCLQVKLGGESVTATLSLQRHRNTKNVSVITNAKLYSLLKQKGIPRIAPDNSETKDSRGEQVCD